MSQHALPEDDVVLWYTTRGVSSQSLYALLQKENRIHVPLEEDTRCLMQLKDFIIEEKLCCTDLERTWVQLREHLEPQRKIFDEQWNDLSYAIDLIPIDNVIDQLCLTCENTPYNVLRRFLVMAVEYIKQHPELNHGQKRSPDGGKLRVKKPMVRRSTRLREKAKKEKKFKSSQR